MKKIKSFFIKLKSKATVKAYQSPLVVTVCLLLLLNLVVIFVGSIVAFNVDPSYFDNSWLNALGTSFKWMISANSINNVMGNFPLMVVAAVVIALEMILFSGAMIATLTTALRGFVNKMSKAKGKIDVANHFVILNWNSKVPELVNNLLVKGFKRTVVILSDKDKDFVTAQVNSVLTKTKNKLSLIVKEGNPMIHSTLEDISIDKATSVVIMSREDMDIGDDINISNPDLCSLKIVLALSNFQYKKKTNIVVELSDEKAVDQISHLSKTLENLRDKNVVPVSFNDKLGELIAQTVSTPEISNIYSDLLSYEGVEFYSMDYEGDVDEYLSTHNDAIPIIKYEKLFVLAEDDDCIDIERKNNKIFNDVKLKIKDYEHQENYSVFIIGQNAKYPAIIDNLNTSASYKGSSVNIKLFDKDDIDGLIEALNKTEGKKKVIILSDDKVSTDSFDANVFVTLIAIQNAFPERENLDIITELLDSRNLATLKDFRINNAIISNKIISLLLTQLALNKNSLKFFNNLFIADNENGGEVFDICVSKANDIIDFSDKLNFNTKSDFIHSFYNSCDKDCMPLGIIHGDERIYVSSNQDEDKEFVIEENDKIIYINY